MLGDVFDDLNDVDSHFGISRRRIHGVSNPNIQFRLSEDTKTTLPEGDVLGYRLSIHNSTKLGDISNTPKASELFPGVLGDPSPLKYCFSNVSEIINSIDLANDLESVSYDKVRSFYIIVFTSSSDFKVRDFIKDLDPLFRRCLSHPHVKLYRLIWSDSTIYGIDGIYPDIQSIKSNKTYGGHIKIIFEFNN